MAYQESKRLRRKVRNSYIISTISVALVLFLLGGVGYLILNAVKATERMKESITIYVMLQDNVDSERTEEIGERLWASEAVREVVFVPKAQAAEEFKEYVGTDFEEFLSFNPLPDSYEVRLNARTSDREVISALEKEVTGWKGVDEVVYQRAVIEQIGTNLNKFNLILLFFGGALLVISLVLLNNTIRISIFSKRYLINTMKLVGASKWFIMKPFLRDSMLQGFYAWLLAAIMFLGLVAGLGESLPEVTFIAERTPVLIILGVMLVGGVLISVLFTTFAINKFVNMNSSRIYLY